MPQLTSILLNNRRASLTGLALVALLFLLPFCSVSCAGTDLVSYRGQQLATGGDASLSLPQQLSGVSGVTTNAPRTPSPDDQFAPSFLQPTAQQDRTHTDIQPLALTAGIAVLAALLVAAVVLRERLRAIAVTVLAMAGAVCLVVLQPVMNHAFSDSLAASQAYDRAHQTSPSSIAVPDLSSLLGLSWSPWYYAAIVGLVLVAGLNVLVLRGVSLEAAGALVATAPQPAMPPSPVAPHSGGVPPPPPYPEEPGSG